MTVEAPEASTPTPEEEIVIAWRTEQLGRAGYPEVAAIALAERSDVDLHLAADLLVQGCPTETALAILL